MCGSIIRVARAPRHVNAGSRRGPDSAWLCVAHNLLKVAGRNKIGEPPSKRSHPEGAPRGAKGESLMKRIVASLVLVSAFGVAQTAHAQYYQPRPRLVYAGGDPTIMPRAYIGFSGFGSAVLNQSGGAELLDNGGGVSVWGGFRFGPVFAL